jgi:hypothetical protein
MILLKMVAATVSVLGDASWRPLLLFVYVWTAYAGWNTFGLPGLVISLALPGISQVLCLMYLWQWNAPILEYYDLAFLCAVLAWLASVCGNGLWNWVELRRIERYVAALTAPAEPQPIRLPRSPAQPGEVA